MNQRKLQDGEEEFSENFGEVPLFADGPSKRKTGTRKIPAPVSPTILQNDHFHENDWIICSFASLNFSISSSSSVKIIVYCFGSFASFCVIR